MGIPPLEVRSATHPLRRVSQLSGDAGLRGAMDVALAKLDGDRYVVPLGRVTSLAVPSLSTGGVATLTLVPKLQRAAEAVLERARAHRGAVVVMALDGSILALAGRDGKRRDPGLATRVWAPAASIFKLVTAAALIDAGVRPDQPVCYHGGLRSIEASNLANDPVRDRRCGDLAHAISRSQNAIIAKLVHRHLDPDQLRSAALAFGFGRAAESALSTELGRATIPDGDLALARVSAGFWQTELSPLGGAVVASTVASGGLAVIPRIVSAIADETARIPVHPRPFRRVVPEHVARDLAHMMIDTTRRGTARKGFRDRKGREFLPGVAVAGKTGSLAVRSPRYVDYSWFVGFAPADDPRVVISVLLGNPARWHLKAHTAARIVLQQAM